MYEMLVEEYVHYHLGASWLHFHIHILVRYVYDHPFVHREMVHYDFSPRAQATTLSSSNIRGISVLHPRVNAGGRMWNYKENDDL